MLTAEEEDTRRTRIQVWRTQRCPIFVCKGRQMGEMRLFEGEIICF
jgi:hypothetical protein